MKNKELVAVFKIKQGSREFLDMAYKIKGENGIRLLFKKSGEIYYKTLDECNEYELNLLPNTPFIWLYKYDRLLNDSLYYFFTITKDYDINYDKKVFYVADYINLIYNDDLPDLLLHVKEINEIGLAVYFYDNYLNADNFDSYYERDGVKYKRVKVNSFAEFKKIVDEYFKK